MAFSITCIVDIHVAEEPPKPYSGTISAEGYMPLEVDIEPKNQREVNIPLEELEPKQVFLITSEQFGKHLTYKINDDKNDAITLDCPHVLIGSGWQGLLKEAPSKLISSNSLENETVSVRIFVAGNAEHKAKPEETKPEERKPGETKPQS